MKTINLLLIVTFILSVGFASCKKNTAAGCSVAWASELNNEIQALSNTLQAYSINPTQENCQAYKAAAQAYVDALTPYGNCATLAGADRDAWQQALNEAQQDVDNINCQ